MNDLTYQKNGEEIYEQEIFNTVFQMVEEAAEFLILDMFMMNEFSDEHRDFPKLSSGLAEKIQQQMEDYPELQVIFITDPINRSYHSHEAFQIDVLANDGAEIIYTDLSELRDPNLLYSGIWRMFFQWFGQEGNGFLSNPFGEKFPNMTIRSYLQLMNIKANHRKVVITENQGMVLSANAQDSSALHSNIAVTVKGPIIKDLVEAERAVAAFSGGDLEAFPSWERLESLFPVEEETTETTMQAQVLTEGKIKQSFLQALEQSQQGDEVWLGMFYLAERDVLAALKEAAERDVLVRLILDPNENTFGSEKMGLPNVPIAQELMEATNEAIEIKWYNTNEEQYHSKIAYLKGQEESYVTLGSTNFTSRNLDDYNLEENIAVTAANDTDFIQDVDSYFQRLWDNEDAAYTKEWDEEDD